MVTVIEDVRDDAEALENAYGDVGIAENLLNDIASYAERDCDDVVAKAKLKNIGEIASDIADDLYQLYQRIGELHELMEEFADDADTEGSIEEQLQRVAKQRQDIESGNKEVRRRRAEDYGD